MLPPVALASCLAWRQAGFNTSGFYLIDPAETGGTDPFLVYCDQETEGGGWAVVFKNHGGAMGGARSNAQLLEGAAGAFAEVITPHTIALVSGVNLEAWEHYRGQGGNEWLKLGTLWDGDSAVIAQQTIRVALGAVTWDWILSRGESSCHVAANPIQVWANGVSLGQTDRVNSLFSDRRSFGLANTAHGGSDACGQPASNLISDPTAELFRLDGADPENGIRHLFSFNHTESGSNASRCQFACWLEPQLSAGYHDGFTWMVR